MKAATFTTLYEELQSLLPPSVFDSLQEAFGLIDRSDCLLEADDLGFTLQDGHTTHRVHLPGGLTEAHYHRIEHRLFDEDKATLALAVIRRAIQPKTWLDWENTKTLARDPHHKSGDDDYQGMLRSIDSLGFAAVIADLKAKIANTPKTPPFRARLVVVEKPVWDGKILSFGNKMWKFRKQDGPVAHLLDTFEKKGWPHSIVPNDLDPDQVREAAPVLRKTRPTIEWSASNDGQISWWLP